MPAAAVDHEWLVFWFEQTYPIRKLLKRYVDGIGQVLALEFRTSSDVDQLCTTGDKLVCGLRGHTGLRSGGSKGAHDDERGDGNRKPSRAFQISIHGQGESQWGAPRIRTPRNPMRRAVKYNNDIRWLVDSTGTACSGAAQTSG